MAQRIIQIIPAPTTLKIARYDFDRAVLYPPVCLALVEKGNTQGVVIMEGVDNEIVELDTEDPDFLGIVDEKDPYSIRELEEKCKERIKKG
jgi:hypothetical protein